MGFLIKKWLGSMLLPLPLLLLVIGFSLLLLWFSRWQKSAKGLLTVSYLLLLLLSLQPVADSLLRPLEQRYSSYALPGRLTPPQTVQYIVVLGGGYTFNPTWAPSANLLNNSLARVTEGVRLYYHLQSNQSTPIKMIFTGAATGKETYSNAQVAAMVANSLGVPNNAIIHLDSPKDTEEEAIACKQVIGKAPFLLVTSANHLPRAIRFFQQQGLSPIPAAANQLAIRSTLPLWDKFTPQPQYLSHSTRFWYETLGTLWQRFK